MADVFDGVDERLGRPVAVKVLRPDLVRRPEVRARFEQEARSAARLSHPNVVGVYDTGEDDDGTPYFIMERLPGETLADRMAAGPQDPAWVVRMAGDVLGALAAAHAAGVVHRDVKPGNILLADDGCAKVADFGIAKTAEEAAGGDTTATGTLLGTPAYLAPERIDGRPATPQSDLYSFGVVLYEALAGTKPFSGETPVAVANAIRHDEPEPLAWLRPGIDPALATAVQTAMSKNPSQRFTDASEMASALGVAIAGGAAGAGVASGRGVVDGDATAFMGHDATSVVDVAPVAAPAAAAPRAARGARRARPIFPLFPLLAGAVVVVAILVLAAYANRDGDGGADAGVDRGSLVNRLHDLAERVKTGDGPQGPELSERLDQVADEVEAGGGSDSATRLLGDVATWHQQRRLFDTAAAEATTLLQQVPGVQASTTTTMAAPTTTVAPVVPPPEDTDDEKGNGRKKDDED
jgi:serine/threonine-protein kinase